MVTQVTIKTFDHHDINYEEDDLEMNKLLLQLSGKMMRVSAEWVQMAEKWQISLTKIGKITLIRTDMAKSIPVIGSMI